MNGVDMKFLERAVQLSEEGMKAGKGGPFGCVIVKGNEIVGEGYNSVLSTNDPTAHAEVVAIRNACQHLNSFQLTGCDIYTSCEPCPMCLGAIYWARPARVIFANTRQEAAQVMFDDDFIYREIELPYEERKIPFIHQPMPKAWNIMKDWHNTHGKTTY